MATPSITMIPSGYKSQKVYSVLPINGDGDLTFDRNNIGTRVNKNGLIEQVATDIPRLDYSDGSCPSLLLEPERTNVIDNSSNFFVGSWSGSRVSEGSTINAPDGNNEAHKLIATSVSNTHSKDYTVSSASSGSYTGSCFFKKGEFNVGVIRMSVDSYANRIGVYINLDNGTHLQTSTVGSPTGTSYKIEDYGNGWYRLSVSIIHTSGELKMSLSNSPSNYSNSNGLPMFLGNDSDGGYSWGGQLEQGSYATSYIPTTDSPQSRGADSAIKDGLSSYISSTEGVLYFEGSSIANDGTFKRISIGTSDDSFANSIQLRYNVVDNSITYQFRVGSVYQADLTITANTTNVNKIACVWKINRFEIWVNGLKQAEDTSGSVPSSNTFNSLFFGKSSNALVEPFKGNIKDLRVYNTALTDAELITLTTI